MLFIGVFLGGNMKNKYLTEVERYQIEALYKKGHSVIEIADFLGRCRATIYNELKRGQIEQLDYRTWTKYYTYAADRGQEIAKFNATSKGRPLKIGNDFEYANYVSYMLLVEKYSPYAVLQKIKSDNLLFKTNVCKNTIYNYVRLGIFKGVSIDKLPNPRKIKNNCIVRKVSLKNTDCNSIENRDPDILTRKSYGHWEMDTVVSGKKGKGALLVLTERCSREEEIYKIASKNQDSVIGCLNLIEKQIGFIEFKKRYKTITCDNGMEFLDFQGITQSYNSIYNRTELYFCHPYSSFERGSNENANKLIRRWIPKGADISNYSEDYIKMVQDWINNYPRKIFNGLSSYQYKKLLGV